MPGHEDQLQIVIPISVSIFNAIIPLLDGRLDAKITRTMAILEIIDIEHELAPPAQTVLLEELRNPKIALFASLNAWPAKVKTPRMPISVLSGVFSILECPIQ